MAQSQFAKPGVYNSFSGVDIKAVFASKVIGELQAISWSITREKAPIYTMGSADPRSFSRGKRGIAGTLIFIVFDRHALLGTLGVWSDIQPDESLMFLSNSDDIRPSVVGGAGLSLNDSVLAANTNSLGTGTTPSTMTSLIDDKQGAYAWYADQIPPFDVTLAAANEAGSLAVMRIFGAEIMNEGCGVSIDDIVTEQQHTYVARAIIGWRPAGTVLPSTVKSPTDTS